MRAAETLRFTRNPQVSAVASGRVLGGGATVNLAEIDRSRHTPGSEEQHEFVADTDRLMLLPRADEMLAD